MMSFSSQIWDLKTLLYVIGARPSQVLAAKYGI